MDFKKTGFSKGIEGVSMEGMEGGSKLDSTTALSVSKGAHLLVHRDIEVALIWVGSYRQLFCSELHLCTFVHADG